jgi:hypothetical protein
MKNFSIYNIYPPLINSLSPRCEIVTFMFQWNPGYGSIIFNINSAVVKIIKEIEYNVNFPNLRDVHITMSYSAYFSTRIIIALDQSVNCYPNCPGSGFPDDQARYELRSHGGCSRDENVGTRIHDDIYGSLGAKKRETVTKKLLCGPFKPSENWDYTSNPCKWCCDEYAANNPPIMFGGDGNNPTERSYCPDFNTYSTNRPLYERYELSTNNNMKKILSSDQEHLNLNNYMTDNNYDVLISRKNI